ncbi:Protein GCY OS=Saccharomyces cerevisiae (strain ATCC 204508 / S288c) GN=GCY1 PE=1 SV=1 [Rhizoctonia solani AG-1 IB]|uniref:Protein GCY n=1 Tax=Thanatephorus cucumeris (strain AG1-IB / isolate 7/3/14) TaxID=1108050 RepID=A0A0B7FNY5_THACB|nr:Protein GCY OS=Saccharomyces cerevisiae (strain ATCC 204508 / S288c) GN=GCY1 PE=1 SV=1 [Rhizoctonia solani AG-1 IB]
MPIHTSVTLNTGAKMPTVGLGTWKSAPGDVGHAVEFALKEAGYRHIDTAYAYRNETEVGQGIKASGVPRSEIFLTTKLPNTHHGAVQAALDESLSNLGTEYLDLWLMHWPAPMKDGKADKSLDWLNAWKQMEKIYETQRDKVKAIGVSNFSVEFLQRLLKEGKITPAVNQIELHPQVLTDVLMTAAKLTNPGIALTAYSPLGSDNSPLLTDPTVTKVAEAHGVHPARILVSIWANTSGVAVLPKSIKPARIAENNKVIELTPEEIAELLKIEQRSKFRACKPLWTGWGTLGFPDVKE